MEIWKLIIESVKIIIWPITILIILLIFIINTYNCSYNYFKTTSTFCSSPARS